MKAMNKPQRILRKGQQFSKIALYIHNLIRPNMRISCTEIFHKVSIAFHVKDSVFVQMLQTRLLLQ